MRHLGRRAITALALVITATCGNKGDGNGEGAGDGGRGETIGEIVSVVGTAADGKGGAELMSTSTSTWKPAGTGTGIAVRDRVRVGPSASVLVTLVGDDRVALNSDTTIKVDSANCVLLEQGEMWVDASFGGTDGGITVMTEEGRVHLEGAFAAVSRREEGLRVSVVSGSARLETGESETVLVGGDEARVGASGDVSTLPIRDPAGLVSWTEGLRSSLDDGQMDGGAPPPPAGGLGTLAAKAPGTGSGLLPFETLGQDVRVRIQDNVAVTEIEQVFENPTNRVVEGMYKFPVPAGARLHRFDMEIKGKMMPGEIVERERGRVIMKTVIRQFVELMRDPALVEWESGSTFKTRIFPIQPHEKKRIVLSYLQPLEGAGGTYRYVLPVAAGGAAAAPIPTFRVDAQVSSPAGAPVVRTPLYPAKVTSSGRTTTVELEQKDFQPPVDLVIEIESPGHADATLATYGDGQEKEGGAPVEKGESDAHDILMQKILAEKGGDEAGWSYFMLTLAPELPAGKKSEPGADWIFLVDTSQSRTAFDAGVQARLVEAMVGALSVQDRVKVMAWDTKPRLMADGWAEPGRDVLEEVQAFLSSVPAGGATDLGRALVAARDELDEGRSARVVVIGDGAATLGETRPGPLADRAERLLGERDVPVTTIGVGSSVDSLLFEEISKRTGGLYHEVSSGEDLLAAAVRIITGMRVPALVGGSVSIEGVETRDVLPERLPVVSAGQDVVVTGRYRGTGEVSVRLAGEVSGEDWDHEWKFRLGEAGSKNSFVPLAWASGRIDALTLAGDDESVAEVVRLSKTFALPSRYTSFIVLENEAMYREFRVEHTEERLEWSGGDEIEYQDQVDILGNVDLSEEAEQDGVLGLLSSSGSGEGLSMDAVKSGGGLAGATKGSGAGKIGSAAKVSKPKPATKAKKSAPKMDMLDLDDPFGGGGGYGGGGSYYYEYRPPKKQWKASVKALPVEMKPADAEKKRAAYEEKIEKEPLVRKHRDRLVDHLVRTGDYERAWQEVREWRDLDGANPQVLGHLGNLARLMGDLDGGIRYMSGMVDMKPEDEKTLESLAAYFESRDQWEDALAYRTTLHVLDPDDHRAAARMAVVASRAGHRDEAKRACEGLVTQTDMGTPKLAKGVKLPKDLKEAVLRISVGEKPPLDYDGPSLVDAGKAKFVVSLTWSGSADLDLWVVDRKGKVLGGQDDKGHLLTGEKGSEGEVFYLEKPVKGRFKVQVLCGTPGGCGAAAGMVKIKAHGTKKDVPFVLEGGMGREVAEIRVKQVYGAVK